jgi:hypothetical protein
LVPFAGRRSERLRAIRIQNRELAEEAISDFSSVQHRRIEAAGCVGRAGLRQIQTTAAVEEALGRMTMMAVSRLEAASNLITIGICEIISSTMERLAVV